MSPFPLNRSVPSIEVIETKIMRVFFRDQILCPWGGGYCRRWPIRGCADEQGMVFILSVLKRNIISQKSVLNSVHVLCRKPVNKLEGFVLNRVCILGLFYAQTGLGFQILSGSPILKYWSNTLLGPVSSMG